MKRALLYCEIIAAVCSAAALALALSQHHWLLSTWVAIALMWIGHANVHRRRADRCEAATAYRR